MLTAHRLSFPTCLFHPRSMHLLCHLDSPSTANLPCLGLQQQTGPEVSELCGSYRVPSRSSLLPLCTLSPGESRSQAKQPVLPIQPPLSPGESVAQTGQQAPRSPALRGHNSRRENRHGLSNRFNNGEWTHGYGFEQDSTHRLDTQTEDVSAFQNQHTGFWISGCTGYLLQRSDGMSGSENREEWRRTPLTAHLGRLFACTRVDTCHPWNCMRSISMHPLCTFSPCQELRINNIKCTCSLE
jgi:hypothetical protein